MEFPEHMAHSMPQTIYSIPSIHSIHSRLCPHHALCAMRSANHTPSRPCATKVQKHMALSMPCAPLSILSILSIMSIFIARSIGTAQSALPANKKSPVPTHGTLPKSKVPYSQAGVRRKPHGLPESRGLPKNDPQPCGDAAGTRAPWARGGHF